MTREEFADALNMAREGRTVTDRGADDRLNAALYDIAAHGATPEREAEARAAFAAMRHT